jgi:hypothetical protein
MTAAEGDASPGVGDVHLVPLRVNLQYNVKGN